MEGLSSWGRRRVAGLGTIDKVGRVQVDLTRDALASVDADVRVVPLFEGEELPPDIASAPGAGDVKASFKRATLLRPSGDARWLVVGLGSHDDLDRERMRVAAAVATKAAGLYSATRLAWAVPGGEPELAEAIVDGTVLASFRFDDYKTTDRDEPDTPSLGTLVLTGVEPGAENVQVARVAAEAENRARALQSRPANDLKPDDLAERAREIAATSEGVEVTVLDRSDFLERGMGGLAAVSSGSDAEPHLIALRYRGGPGETVGYVGKGVTFDAGGISIKPAGGMQDMKMDMSGAAAVLEAFAAIVELAVAIDLVAVVPTTENMLSGGSMRPGDIITQLNGKTVEINNTDAEGRLILADALTFCRRDMGADRIVDIATLTGAVVVALGSTYAALISNDDEWAASVEAAGRSTGELAWRLPLHPEYKELTKGKVGDLTNAAAKRKAGTIYAASFLEEFVDDVPWAHLDIAGTAWDTGRDYVGSGPTGFGVRLLVELARTFAASA
jgi:leucyl aminopeptidase